MDSGRIIEDFIQCGTISEKNIGKDTQLPLKIVEDISNSLARQQMRNLSEVTENTKHQFYPMGSLTAFKTSQDFPSLTKTDVSFIIDQLSKIMKEVGRHEVGLDMKIASQLQLLESKVERLGHFQYDKITGEILTDETSALISLLRKN